MKTAKIILVFSLIVLSIGSISQAAETKTAETEENQTEVIENDCNCYKRGPFQHVSRRTEHPLQAHVIVTGGGWRHGGNNPGGGLSVGYQVSKLMSLSLTSQIFYNERDFWSDRDKHEYDNENNFLGQEGVKETTSEIDPRHLVEMRFFPWNFGLYFSAGILHVGKQKTTIEFKNRTRTVGENEYKTGLTAELDYEAWTGAAAGIGFNHIFKSGFSLGVGFNAGLGMLTPDTTLTSTAAVSNEDMEDWRDEIEQNEIKMPYMFQFGVGYAF
jgi:hypothetical protein